MDISGRVRALLLLCCICQGDSQEVEIPNRELEVVKGQTVVLQAWYSPTSDISRNTVLWNFMANDSKLVISYSNGEPGVGSPEFRKRAGFSRSMPSANLSIYINNTQESDSGRYLCSVLIPGVPGLLGEVRLNVKVPPSPPVCTMTGSPVLNGNVTLSCKSSSGKPVPQYKWTKTAPMTEVFFSPLQNEMQGTLRLSHLNKNMSGKYVCRASNTAGSDTCSINLEVFTTSNVVTIAAATLGSAVGLVAIIIFLIFLMRKSRDREEEEIANEIKEDAQAPKRVSWAKSGTGSDIISKNGTQSSIATSPNPQDSHQPNNYHYPYPAAPASDTGSVLNAYRLRPGEPNLLQGLPGYNIGNTPPSGRTRPLSVANNIGASSPNAHSRPPSSNHLSGMQPPGHNQPLCTSIIVDTPLHGFSQPPSSNLGGVAAPHEQSRPAGSNDTGAPSSHGHSRPPSSNKFSCVSSHEHSRPPSLNHVTGTSPKRQSRPTSSNHSWHPRNGSIPHYGPSRSSSSNGVSPSHKDTDPNKTEGAQPQVPRHFTLPISSATLTRMGAVPVMVPAQSQAGSLV